MDQLKIPLADIPRIAGESLAIVYDAINAGHLATFLVGRRRFARPDAIRAWVEAIRRKWCERNEPQEKDAGGKALPPASLTA